MTFFFIQFQFTFSNFYMDFSFPSLFVLFFSISIWTFHSLFYLDFSFSIRVSIQLFRVSIQLFWVSIRLFRVSIRLFWVSILFNFVFTPIAVTFWISSNFFCYNLTTSPKKLVYYKLYYITSFSFNNTTRIDYISKVNSAQEACAKCFVIHILKFEISQTTQKK